MENFGSGNKDDQFTFEFDFEPEDWSFQHSDPLLQQQDVTMSALDHFIHGDFESPTTFSADPLPPHPPENGPNLLPTGVPDLPPPPHAAVQSFPTATTESSSGASQALLNEASLNTVLAGLVSVPLPGNGYSSPLPQAAMSLVHPAGQSYPARMEYADFGLSNGSNQLLLNQANQNSFPAVPFSVPFPDNGPNFPLLSANVPLVSPLPHEAVQSYPVTMLQRSPPMGSNQPHPSQFMWTQPQTSYLSLHPQNVAASKSHTITFTSWDPSETRTRQQCVLTNSTEYLQPGGSYNNTIGLSHPLDCMEPTFLAGGKQASSNPSQNPLRSAYVSLQPPELPQNILQFSACIDHQLSSPVIPTVGFTQQDGVTQPHFPRTTVNLLHGHQDHILPHDHVQPETWLGSSNQFPTCFGHGAAHGSQFEHSSGLQNSVEATSRMFSFGNSQQSLYNYDASYNSSASLGNQQLYVQHQQLNQIPEAVRGSNPHCYHSAPSSSPALLRNEQLYDQPQQLNQIPETVSGSNLHCHNSTPSSSPALLRPRQLPHCHPFNQAQMTNDMGDTRCHSFAVGESSTDIRAQSILNHKTMNLVLEESSFVNPYLPLTVARVQEFIHRQPNQCKMTPNVNGLQQENIVLPKSPRLAPRSLLLSDYQQVNQVPVTAAETDPRQWNAETPVVSMSRPQTIEIPGPLDTSVVSTSLFPGACQQNELLNSHSQGLLDTSGASTSMCPSAIQQNQLLNTQTQPAVLDTSEVSTSMYSQNQLPNTQIQQLLLDTSEASTGAFLQNQLEYQTPEVHLETSGASTSMCPGTSQQNQFVNSETLQENGGNMTQKVFSSQHDASVSNYHEFQKEQENIPKAPHSEAAAPSLPDHQKTQAEQHGIWGGTPRGGSRGGRRGGRGSRGGNQGGSRGGRRGGRRRANVVTVSERLRVEENDDLLVPRFTNFRPIRNAVYDQKYEDNNIPIDPHIRMLIGLPPTWKLIS